MEEKLISFGTDRVVLNSGRVILPIALESVSSSDGDESDENIPEKLFEVVCDGELDFCSSYHLPKEDILLSIKVAVLRVKWVLIYSDA